MRKMVPVTLLAAAALGGLAAACGELQIRKNLPDSIQTVAIPVFENRSVQPNVENDLTRKAVQNFIVDGRLRVVAREQADAELKGVIQRYDRIVLTRDANQVPQQYKLQVAVDIDFTDLKTGQQLWSTRPVISLTPGVEPAPEDYDSTNTRSLREFTNYYVLNVAGVPPEDEATAQDRVLEQMARRIVRRTLDGF